MIVCNVMLCMFWCAICMHLLIIIWLQVVTVYHCLYHYPFMNHGPPPISFSSFLGGPVHFTQLISYPNCIIVMFEVAFVNKLKLKLLSPVNFAELATLSCWHLCCSKWLQVAYRSVRLVVL